MSYWYITIEILIIEIILCIVIYTIVTNIMCFKNNIVYNVYQFFFIFAFITRLRGHLYSYHFSPPISINNHILIYSRCPHMLPNDPHPFILWPIPSPISLYYHFTYLFDYAVISGYHFCPSSKTPLQSWELGTECLSQLRSPTLVFRISI